jgi:hypothetical protein
VPVRKHPRLYEISAWPWLERLSRREGRRITLRDVPAAEWDAIAANRFDLLFLMGVWRRSPIGREIARSHPGLRSEYDRVLPGWTPDDVPGSPYCIQAYEPDERMGGWDGIHEARRQLHARGVGLVLDFVPNHTAFDHPWIASHPERYVLADAEDAAAAPGHFRPVARGHVACGRDPYFDPWTDVAQLNYFNPDTRRALLDTLRTIATLCDGIRCDMAMLVLNDIFEGTWRRVLRGAWPIPPDEFWPEAKAAVPGLLFLAEAYWGLEGRLLDLGFDFVYGKDLLDALHAPEGAQRVRRPLESPHAHRLARFLENHDEPRSAATLAPRLPAAASIVAAAPGMRFFYDGQFEGRRVKVPVQLGRWPDEPQDDVIRALYERILAFASDEVFHEGEWRLPPITHAGDDTHHQIVALRWKTGQTLALVVANVGGMTAQAHVDVSADLPPRAAFDFADALTGETYRWTMASLQEHGLYVRLGPGAAHLFTVR